MHKMKQNNIGTQQQQHDNGIASSSSFSTMPISSVAGAPTFRNRKLSNSSLASDVSFRLPTYDSPATYNFQSDFESASEFEADVTNNTNLDLIKKEHLHDAYKKAMEKYQKYRERYLEVARRYRDLERDNSKARVIYKKWISSI